MSTFLDDSIRQISDEREHFASINECIIYFHALAESRRRGHVSDLFEVLPHGLPTGCDDNTARQLHEVITEFIEKCSSHPNVGSCFRILFNLGISENLKSYLLSKLKLYHGQGNAENVFQICVVLTDMGEDIFRDENGGFMQSRSSYEGEINLGVARRYLERLK